MPMKSLLRHLLSVQGPLEGALRSLRSEALQGQRLRYGAVGAALTAAAYVGYLWFAAPEPEDPSSLPTWVTPLGLTLSLLAFAAAIWPRRARSSMNSTTLRRLLYFTAAALVATFGVAIPLVTVLWYARTASPMEMLSVVAVMIAATPVLTRVADSY